MTDRSGRVRGPGRMSRMPLRLRLVAGFSAVMLVVLSGAGAFVYWRVKYALDRGFDSELQQAARALRPLLGADGSVSDLRAAAATGVGWQTLTATGDVLAHGGPTPAAPLVGGSVLRRTATAPHGVTRDVGTLLPAARRPYRVLVTRAAGTDDTAGRDRVFVLVAVRRDHRDEALRELLLQLTVAGLAALVLTAAIGDRLAWFALMPVERYRRRADDIAGGAVGVRLEVPSDRDDEVTRLGHTLNRMLAQLERSIARERRFVDDASHELRTPLTLLTSRVQLARRRTRTVAEHEEVLRELDVDLARLTDLAAQLLALGAADDATGQHAGETDAVECVGRLVARHRIAHSDPVVELRAALPGTPVVVAVQETVLERIVGNLVGNALVHGRPPVDVVVDVVTDDSADDGDGAARWGRVVVSDAGPGMSAGQLATATERFGRAAEARALPGAGLGLSLVEALVVAAGGALRLCHAGHHVTFGTGVGVACAHDDRLTVTVLLPGR